MSDGRRRPARTPAKGKPWPKMVRDAALELLRKGATLPEAMAGLEERFEFRPSPPARSALAKWAKVAGVTVNVTPANRRDTSRALEARLERMAAERDALSELLIGDLARPAADALARRLARSATDEELLVAARDKWADALRLEAMAADFNPEEVKAARRATRQAMLEVRIAEVNLIGDEVAGVAGVGRPGIGHDDGPGQGVARRPGRVGVAADDVDADGGGLGLGALEEGQELEVETEPAGAAAVDVLADAGALEKHALAGVVGADDGLAGAPATRHGAGQGVDGADRAPLLDDLAAVVEAEGGRAHRARTGGRQSNGSASPAGTGE